MNTYFVSYFYKTGEGIYGFGRTEVKSTAKKLDLEKIEKDIKKLEGFARIIVLSFNKI